MTDAASDPVAAGKAILERALHLPDRTQRMLGVAGAVQRALADVGLRPVIVGGLAVEYYTAGEYVTGDIDVLVPTTGAVTARLDALGFHREGRYGRHWTLPGHDIIWEMPGSHRAAEDHDPREVEFAPGEAVLMLRLEDVLVHRVEEWVVATGHLDAWSRRSRCWAHAAARTWSRKVRSAFGSPYRRMRPRPATEAHLLAQIGTPEQLIGPVVPDPDRQS